MARLTGPGVLYAPPDRMPLFGTDPGDLGARAVLFSERFAERDGLLEAPQGVFRPRSWVRRSWIQLMKICLEPPSTRRTRWFIGALMVSEASLVLLIVMSTYPVVYSDYKKRRTTSRHHPRWKLTGCDSGRASGRNCDPDSSLRTHLETHKPPVLMVWGMRSSPTSAQ